MPEYNISLVRGDTLSFGAYFEDLNQDLSAAYFTCRKGWGGQKVFQKTLGTGITKKAQNTYAVRVAPSDTASLTTGLYVYDFEVRVNGDVYTILRGSLDLLPEATY